MAAPLIGLGIGLELLGKGLGLFDDQQQAKEEEARLERNRQLALMAAQDAVQRGTIAAGEARSQGTRQIAQAEVATSHGGVDTTVGTPAQGAGLTRSISELDAMTIQNNAAREAWGLQQQADEYSAQAERVRQRASNSLVGGLLGGLGDVVTGAARLGAFDPGSTVPPKTIGGSSLDDWAKKWGYDSADAPEFKHRVSDVTNALDWSKGY